MDRISELPEFVVHHILSFLDCPKDLVRTSVLSKKWFVLTASNPNLVFDIVRIKDTLIESGISGEIFIGRKRFDEMVFRYVDYTLSRFCKEKMSAHTFKLNTKLDVPSDAMIVDRWIGLVVEKEVKVFHVDIATSPLWSYYSATPEMMYRLPDKLLSASSLTSLEINGCLLPLSLVVNGVKFKLLKFLFLRSVAIDEEMLKCLTTGCPLLEEVIIEECYGFKRLCLDGLYNLKKLWIAYGHGVERIDIVAPNLNYLCLIDLRGKKTPCIIVASCEKLAALSFYGSSPSMTWFAEFFSKFPVIENLFMCIPNQCHNLKVSSDSLRKIVLNQHCDLEKLEIDAPSLLSFEYSDDDSHPHLFHSSNQLILNAINENFVWVEDVEAFCFQKLKRFLDQNNGIKVLKLHIDVEFTGVDALKEIQSPPCELEHVELNLGMILPSSVYAVVVDALLWCCSPRSLTLRSDLPFIYLGVLRHVVKFAYDKLLEQVDQGQTNTRILISYSASKGKNRFINLDSFFTALHAYRRGQSITFVKERVVEEAGQMSASTGIA